MCVCLDTYITVISDTNCNQWEKKRKKMLKRWISRHRNNFKTSFILLLTVSLLRWTTHLIFLLEMHSYMVIYNDFYRVRCNRNSGEKMSEITKANERKREQRHTKCIAHTRCKDHLNERETIETKIKITQRIQKKKRSRWWRWCWWCESRKGNVTTDWMSEKNWIFKEWKRVDEKTKKKSPKEKRGEERKRKTCQTG